MRLLRMLGLMAHFAVRRLDRLLPEGRMPLWSKVLLAPLRLLPQGAMGRGERLAQVLEAQGPVFIKFGQFLSTRPDLLPADIAAPLARLRDDCEPLAEKTVRQVILSELGGEPEQLFGRFDPTPLAAASLAQVHAVEIDGREMVVKLQRPNVEKRVQSDLRLLLFAADLAHRFLGAHLRLPEVARTFAQIMEEECDFRLEAARTSRMAKNAAKHGLLRIPAVHWPQVTKRILVMERIRAISVSDFEALQDAGVDLKLLAERGARVFFTQLFEDNFFHGDMHPGNIMVLAESPEDPRYAAVDCAVAGELDEDELLVLGRIFNALLAGDFRRVAELMLAVGWVAPTTSVADLDLALRVACEHQLEQPLEDVHFGELLGYLFEVAGRYGFIAQPSLALLAKTLINVEGMGRQLYPKLNFWGLLRNMLAGWSRRRLSPGAVAHRFRRRMEKSLGQSEKLPQLAFRALENLAEWNPQREAQYRRSSQSSWLLFLLGGAAVAILLLGLDRLEYIDLLQWVQLWRGLR